MTETRTPEGVNTSTGEIVPLGLHNRRAEMVNAATDSWTAVYVDARSLAVDVATSELVPEAVRGDAKKTLALILYGRELGLPPLTSLKNVFIIKGRAGVYAETMRAMILSRGHRLRTEELTDTRCVMLGCRREDDPAVAANWTRYEYTMQDATRAGDVAKNPNYKARPKDMLSARATTGLAKLLFSDVIGGLDSVEAAVTADDVLEGSVAVPKALPAAAPRTSVQRSRSRVKEAPDAPADVVDAEVVETAADGPTAPASTGRTRDRSVAAPGPVSARPVTDSGPAEQPAFAVEDHDAEIATQPQIGKLGAQMSRLGFGDDREGRLRALGMLVGHPITSAKDLTRAEADTLIRNVERCRDRNAFDALVASMAPDAEGVES